MTFEVIRDLLIYTLLIFGFILLFQRLIRFRHLNSWRKDIIISIVGTIIALFILFIAK